MKLSVVVPVYDEGASVSVAHDAIARVLRDRLPAWQHEVIFVDDGSGDDSFRHLEALVAEQPDVRVIRLARNVGAHTAIRAGLDHAAGDAACFLACDLQDPPEVIPALLAALQPPVEVVWAARRSRQDSLFSRTASRAFFWLARRLASNDLPPGGASMALLGPCALQALGRSRDRHATLERMLAALALPQAHVPYDRRARPSGAGKWTLRRKLALAASILLGTGTRPDYVVQTMLGGQDAQARANATTTARCSSSVRS